MEHNGLLEKTLAEEKKQQAEHCIGTEMKSEPKKSIKILSSQVLLLGGVCKIWCLR